MLNLSTLNPQQREAVEAIHGPVLILAGAGTGKTRVITTRIAYLIEQRIPPSHILGVTFTNKAAREMLERVNSLVPRPLASEGGKAERPTVCTFHSLCVRILRQYIERLGYKRNFVIYDEAEQLGVIKKILSHLSAKGEAKDPAVILAMLSRLRNAGSRAAARGDAGVEALAQHIRARYELALHACNAVDFDDLILLTLRLFREHGDVLDACRGKYQYVMVDEYQDTNAAQFELVQALTCQHRNLCVVGDDDQSIYGWRGAEAANLIELERHFPEVKIIRLEQNYRSTTTILSAANALITHNVRRRSKRLWSEKGRGAKICLATYGDENEEARTVAEEIDFARKARRIPWSQHAILFRTNQQARPLETALRQAGVRYHLVGGQSYFDRREIRDLLAYLKVFLNPHDDISLLRIANVPARGLSEVTMERLLAASHERKCSVYLTLINPTVVAAFPARTRECLERFAVVLKETHVKLERLAANLGPRPLQSWAEDFLQSTGYLDEVRRMEKDAEAGESRVRNVRELVASLDAQGDASAAPSARLHDFLEQITLDREREEDKETRGDAVTLITIHSCKGLEFPHVYIVGLEDGLLPHTRSKADGTLDEERRLFYVAITRAMLTLKLSYSLGRLRYGQVLPSHPSPFLQELPADLLEHADDRASTPVSPEQGKQWFAAMRAAIQ